MSEPKDSGLLAGLRVLDLADEKGLFCGKLLADLGADVVKVERPGGDPARSIGPFYGDTPHPEKSLFWFAFNGNKRGITLNIEAAEGQQLLRRLAEAADFVVESFSPGYMAGLGLGYDTLSQINPRLIMTSITPFGQDGPYRDYKGSDLAIFALSGFMYLIGDPDRPPVVLGYPQSYSNAGAEAAIGTLIAHYHRGLTREGQHVDTSAQATMSYYAYHSRLIYELAGGIPRRMGIRGGGRTSGLGGPLTMYPCKDGYISFVLYGAGVGTATNKALVDWMQSRGMAPDFLLEIDWANLDMFTLTQEDMNRIEDAFSRFFRTLTKEEFYAGALERGMMGYPVSTVEDVLRDPQLSARDFWTEVPHPELGTSIKYPGVFARPSRTPLKLPHRAPLIGEHNREIYQDELGLSAEELRLLQQKGIV